MWWHMLKSSWLRMKFTQKKPLWTKLTCFERKAVFSSHGAKEDHFF
jgi:hypothetical protein